MTARPRLTFLLALGVIAVVPTDALAGVRTVAAQGDTYVTDRYGTRNFEGEPTMRVHSNPVKRGLVRFEVGTLDGPVEKAVLRVYAETGAPNGFRVYAIPATWNPATVTHNNAPAPGALLATVAPFTTQNSWREYDVTAAVPGAGARAFMITAPAASTDVVLTTIEGGRAPELVITTLTAPASTAPPTISGTAQVGSTLSAQPGTWTGATPIAHAYRWRRCNTAGASCTDIAGATSASYTLVQADLGATIRAQVTASNSHGSAVAVSAQTGTVAPAPTTPPPPPSTPPANTAVPQVSGTPSVGRLLLTTTGSWSGTQPQSYAYEWLRCPSAGGTCTTIAGATAASYTVVQSDVGMRLRSRVTASNGAGSAQAMSAQTGVVTPASATPGATCTGNDIAYASTAPGSNAAIVFRLGSRTYPCGRFANGDWYIVGPAVIEQITPAIIGSGGSLRHGVDVNPAVTSGNDQRWDGRLNGVRNPTVTFPYTASPGQSIVKYVSNNPGGGCTDDACGRFAAVLTVLASAPASPATTFRPPYWGTHKPLLSTDALNLDLLSRRSSSCCSAKITRALAEFRTRHLRLDTSPSSVDGGGSVEPIDAYSGSPWGAEVLKNDTEVALWLMLDNACPNAPCSAAADRAAKLPVVIGFVQNGIDLWGGTRGGLVHLRGGGGNAAGKLFLEVFAATLLQNTTMASEIAAAAANPRIFWETFSLYRSTVTGKALWGQMYHSNDATAAEELYWSQLKTCTNCNLRDPYQLIDGGAQPGTSYQRSTMLPTKYAALILRLVPQMAAYWPGSHETVVMDYADRVVANGTLTMPDSCAPKSGTYGVHYGPNGNGGCITKPGAPGRVPEYNGTTVDGEGNGSRRSDFGDQMWKAFR